MPPLATVVSIEWHSTSTTKLRAILEYLGGEYSKSQFFFVKIPTRPAVTRGFILGQGVELNSFHILLN